MADGKSERPPKHSLDFKRNAVQHCFSTSKTQQEDAEDLGVPARTLGKWAQASSKSEKSGAIEEGRTPAQAAADFFERLKGMIGQKRRLNPPRPDLNRYHSKS